MADIQKLKDIASQVRRDIIRQTFRCQSGHPGGSLGRKLVRVADIMHSGSELPLVAASAPMSEVLLDMTSQRFGCAGVVDPDVQRAMALELAVLEGQLNKQIAHSLGMSEATVKAHMTAIMRKLDVRNRTQAALVARSLGLDLKH